MAANPHLRILITAGPTREYIDPVRYIGNDSSGRMGFALAAAAVQRGHRVTLVHGPVALTPPRGCRVVAVTSAEQMLRACARLWPSQDVLVMAAAVCDYCPRRIRRSKIKRSGRELRLTLRPTPDVLATLAAARRPTQVVVGFALEDTDARSNAERKLRRKHLDAIVLNRPAAIGAERASLEIFIPGSGWQRLARSTKPQLAMHLMCMIERLAFDPQRLENSSPRARITHALRCSESSG